MEIRKFKVKIKMEGEMIVTDSMFYEETDKLTPEFIKEVEEENIKSDPTYFDYLENQKITVEVEEIKEIEKCDCKKETCRICHHEYCDHINCKCIDYNMR
jgi:hypothetical protein